MNSAIQGGLYTSQVIAEQIRRSLQGEAKTKLVGIGADSDPRIILEKLDQFYSDVGAATGDEVLSEAYQIRQRENEEVAALAKIPQKILSDQSRGENAHYLLSLWRNRPYTSWVPKSPKARLSTSGKRPKAFAMGRPEVLNFPPPQSNQLTSVLKELTGEANETVTIINGHACIGC